MLIPKIQVGQTAGVVVPARKVDEALLRKGCAAIESWGLKVRFADHCFSNANEYLAAADADRLEDLQKMIDDPSIDLIFCARGGYGTARIIDQLVFDKFTQRPKWIVGFSDITALHLRLNQLGIPSIHGPMPVQYSKPEYTSSLEALKNLLFGDQRVAIQAPSSKMNRPGVASGIAVGGNLSLVVDSLGTPTSLDGENKILIVEEIDEQLYKIDRMFNHLKRSGKLSHLAGLVIGHMTDIKDTELPFSQTVEELIMDKVSAFSYPVAFNFPIGHDAPNYPWVESATATLKVSTEKGELVFD